MSEAATPAPETEASPSRSGRNLPVAIAVGVCLAVVVLATLYTLQELFVGLVVVVLGLATHEICTALQAKHYQVPVIPLMAGGALMLVVAYADGIDALAIATLLTLICGFASRVALPSSRPILPDLAVGAFVVVYLPLLAAFAMVLLASDDGPDRVVVFILAVVLSDTGGYAVGVLFGRHKMSPVVSPKKSWEGLGGSVLFASVGTAVSVPILLGQSWWLGAILGALVVASATLGDLTESLIKRDLGLKDMGRLLPAHGGLMDRLDSLLPTAPVVVAFFAIVVS